MTAEQDEGGDVPAHDEYGYCKTEDGGAGHVHLAKVFGSKKQRIGAITVHETAAYSTEK
jgi:hypothetical protein